VARLRAAAEPLVKVVAPAGYGKTTALAQWSRVDERPFAWVSLDATDEDPVVLFRHVVEALDAIEPFGTERLGALTAGPPPLSTVALPRLGRYLNDRQQPFVLVFDDLPAEAPTELFSDVLSLVVSSLPRDSTLVLTGRRQVPLPRTSLRAQGAAFSVGVEDLALSEAESRLLLRSAGVQLPPDDVEIILRKTEGWPIAVHLVALLLRSRPEAAQALERVIGGRSPLVEFLEQQLLAQVETDTARFLLRSSILHRLSGPSCDWILQSVDSDRRLKAISGANLLLFPVDREQETYRYHQLFAEMLRSKLYATEPEAAAELHRRASDWCLRHDDLDAAMAHARAVQDLPRAATVMWVGVARLLPVGQRATVERWLAGFSDDQVSQTPRMALAAAWCAVQGGRPLDVWIAAAERAASRLADPSEAASIRAAVALLRAVVARHGLRQMAKDAELAYRLDDENSAFRTVACFMAGSAHDLIGDPAHARVWLEEGARLAVLLDVPSIHAQCLAELAIVALAEGDWGQQARCAAAAMAEVEKYGLADSAAPIATVFVAAALAAAHRGASDEAREASRRALRMLTMLTNIAPWLAVQSPIALARAHLMIGDIEAARVLAADAASRIEPFADASALHARLAETVEMLEQVAGAPDGEPSGPTSVLTSAQMQILQYLPTHLTFEEIGTRLGLPQRAVKARVISIYRKFGVVSRAEAVERGLVLGLIAAQDPPSVG
jgi:LuxR family maltose regulon positive regulatory protein